MIVILFLLVVTAVLTWSALSNYWRETNLPRFDIQRDRLHGLRRRGAGPRLLMIHGLAASSRFWEPMIAQLPQNYDVLAPDLLGFGLSPKPSANYDLNEQVAAIEALMQQHHFAAEGPIVLVAHSMGALVAMQLAVAYPNRFARVVFISTPCYPNAASAAECLAKVSIMHKGVLHNSAWVKAMCFALHGRKWPNIGHLFGIPEPVFTAGGQHTWESLSKSLQHSVIEVDVSRLLSKLIEPVMFIHGDCDRVAPVDYVRRLLSQSPQIPLHVISGADHSLPLTHAEVVADLIAPQ